MNEMSIDYALIVSFTVYVCIQFNGMLHDKSAGGLRTWFHGLAVGKGLLLHVVGMVLCIYL
jgi:hypothetical protein